MVDSDSPGAGAIDGLAGGAKKCGGVEAASGREDALRGAHPLGQRVEQFGGNAHVVVERRDAEIVQRIELRAAADSARAAGDEVAFESLQIRKLGVR